GDEAGDGTTLLHRGKKPRPTAIRTPALCIGRTGLAAGSLPASVPTGAPTTRDPGQGRESNGGGEKESHLSTSLRMAVARQLAVDLWRWQTGQCSPEKLGLAC